MKKVLVMRGLDAVVFEVLEGRPTEETVDFTVFHGSDIVDSGTKLPASAIPLLIQALHKLTHTPTDLF